VNTLLSILCYSNTLLYQAPATKIAKVLNVQNAPCKSGTYNQSVEMLSATSKTCTNYRLVCISTKKFKTHNNHL
jgi:hypothetical protein